MIAPQFPKVSRRVTLQWMAATSLAAGLSRWSHTRGDPPSPAPLGYGTDPDLKNPIVPWSLTMSTEQLKKTALLADLILPGTASAPAASAIGVHDFINEWVSAPYPDQVRDRGIVFEGLQSLDVDDLASGKATLSFDAHDLFFQRFRFLVVGGYYTTPEGWKDIGYIGNVPLASYPPVTDEERAILDKALSKLGLK